MANEDMILKRLEAVFGKDPQFNKKIVANMRQQILLDLRNGV